MMGSGLLAEMKAKQERRAHKVGRANFYCVTSVQDPQVKEHPHTCMCSCLQTGQCSCQHLDIKTQRREVGVERWREAGKILGSSWANVLNADTGILLSQESNSIG